MERQRLIKLFAEEMLKLCKLIRLKRLKKIKKGKKRCAVRKNLQERREKGYFHSLIPEMRLKDVESFKNFHSMDPTNFDELLHIIGPSLKNQPIRSQEEITSAERLSLTLRYLTSGDSMKSIGYYGFRIGLSTTSIIIRETCQLIWEKLQFVFPTPSEKMWSNVADSFFEELDFPNCLGALNIKHIVVQHTFSWVLMTIVDAHLKFIMMDIAAFGRNSDEVVFENSKFAYNILYHPEELKIPKATPITHTNDVTPFVFLADESFPLCKNIMCPYPGIDMSTLPQEEMIFNKHLSRAYKVADNAFSILANSFRIYQKSIVSSKETAEGIVKATICLHNWLLDKDASENLTMLEINTENEELWNPSGWKPIVCSQNNHPPQDAINNRKIFMKYFSVLPENNFD